MPGTRGSRGQRLTTCLGAVPMAAVETRPVCGVRETRMNQFSHLRLGQGVQGPRSHSYLGVKERAAFWNLR